MANAARKHTFTVIQDLYEEDEETGKHTLVKGNVKLEYDCYLDDIKSVREITNDKGKKISNRCMINHSDDGQMVVLGSKHQVSEIVFGKADYKMKIGFKINKNKHDNGRKINDNPDTGKIA